MNFVHEATPGVDDLVSAYRLVRLSPWLTATPVLTSPALDALTGCSLYFKCEMLQRSGSFKARGAVIAVASLTQRRLLTDLTNPRPVVVCTHSSGNHGTALAYASACVGVRAVIVVPTDAPEGKRAAIRSHGAEIVPCAPGVAAREAACAAVVASTGAVFVHPSNCGAMIAGGASIAFEVLQQMGNRPVAPLATAEAFGSDAAIDVIVAPVGGAGLLSGIALAIEACSPRTRVVGVEPSNADDAHRSRLAGERLVHAGPVRSLADGLLTVTGSVTWPIVRDCVHAVPTVSETEILAAMQLLWEHLKVLAEPSAAVGLAALLADRHRSLILGGVAEGRRPRVVVVLSGGNGVDYSPVFDHMGSKL